MDMIWTVMYVLIGVFLIMLALMYIKHISYHVHEMILLLILFISGGVLMAYGVSLL